MKRILLILIGIACFFTGLMLAINPLFPFGYPLLFIGLFLLAPYFPPIRNLLDWIERRDKSEKFKRFREHIRKYLD